MIAGYAGKSDALDRAMCRFARAYADQTEADHATLVRAVAQGEFPVERVDPPAKRRPKPRKAAASRASR
jgi:hypothetical protein